MDSIISGRSPPLYCTLTLISMQGHQNHNPFYLRVLDYKCLKKNQNAPRLGLLSIPQSVGKNVKTLSRWDHRLQIQNIFMAFKRIPLW